MAIWERLVTDFIEMYRPQAARHGIDVSLHLASDLPSIDFDPLLMRQVLQNLVLNAEQAMVNGGQLEIQTRASNGRVELTIIDTGPG
ncbi:MAG: hypothetical protein R3B90_22840 [Planctomycetaceae bacterium]